MAREKKDGHFLTCYLRQDLWEEIDEHSKETRIPKTSIIEKALEEYFNKYGNMDANKER